MSKKVTEKSKPKNRKRRAKELSMTPFLYLGMILIILNLVLNSVIKNMPDGISTMLYLFGILALVVYMLQVAFEKRTGKAELSEDEIKALKKQQKKKSRGK